MRYGLLLLFLITYYCIKSEEYNETDFRDPGTPNVTENDSTDKLLVFSAKINNKTIFLNWRLGNPKSTGYFEVLRLDPKKKHFVKINDNKILKDDFLEKSQTAGGLPIYMFDFEDSPERDGVYYYKLKAYTPSGQLLFESDEIKIGVTGIRNFNLEQNKPNPFNPVTNISYELYEPSYVKLKVFDLIGKEIATLFEGYQQSGIYTYQFNVSGYENLTSGIYFYKLETEKYAEVKKMIYTK